MEMMDTRKGINWIKMVIYKSKSSKRLTKSAFFWLMPVLTHSKLIITKSIYQIKYQI